MAQSDFFLKDVRLTLLCKEGSILSIGNGAFIERVVADFGRAFPLAAKPWGALFLFQSTLS